MLQITSLGPLPPPLRGFQKRKPRTKQPSSAQWRSDCLSVRPPYTSPLASCLDDVAPIGSTPLQTPSWPGYPPSPPTWTPVIASQFLELPLISSASHTPLPASETSLVPPGSLCYNSPGWHSMPTTGWLQPHLPAWAWKPAPPRILSVPCP